MIEQILENLKRLTTRDRDRVVSELSKPESATRPTLPQDTRRKLAADNVTLREYYEAKSAELTQEHEAALAEAERAKRKAGTAWAALSDLGSAFREQRDAIVLQLRESMEPEVVAFLEEMNRELAELPARQQVAGFHIRHRSGAMDRTQRIVDNAASLSRRRDAIRAAIQAAERLSLEALDSDELPRRLAALRDALPAIEDINVLAEAARRSEQAAIDNAPGRAEAPNAA